MNPKAANDARALAESLVQWSRTEAAHLVAIWDDVDGAEHRIIHGAPRPDGFGCPAGGGHQQEFFQSPACLVDLISRAIILAYTRGREDESR